MTFKHGPLGLFLSKSEIEEIMGQPPLGFISTFIERFNEIKNCKVTYSDQFSRVFDYFNEAKRCYLTGNYRSSIIATLSALECCLRIDYRMDTGNEWTGGLFQIINMYFGQQGKLPSAYSELGQISDKVRNDITHPCHEEEYEYTYSTAWHILEIVKELINFVINNRT